jgi:hypothetical protein
LTDKKVAVVGTKRGTPLSAIEGIDASLLDLLRGSYGITTLEEFVEAVSFSAEVEREATQRTKGPGHFKYAYDRAREILGPDAVFKLQRVRQKYPTGALKPSKS